MMHDQEWSRMGGADGAILLPGDLARLLVQSDQVARPRVMVPGKQNRILKHQRAQGVSPSHLRIAERRQVARNPNQLAVMGVAGDVRIAKGHVDRILRDRRGVDGQVGFLVGPLVHAKAEVMSPKLLAALPVEAERQQRFLAALLMLGSDEHSAPVDHRRTGAPSRQLDRPADVLRLTPSDRQDFSRRPRCLRSVLSSKASRCRRQKFSHEGRRESADPRRKPFLPTSPEDSERRRFRSEPWWASG